MSNLYVSMSVAGNTLEVYRQALDVVQNNLLNANTAGYAKQTLRIVSQPFDITSGMTGGVAAGGLQSARDEYAEQEVRRQTQSLGWFEAQAEGTAFIENSFDVTGKSGLPLALNNLIQSFSAWSVSPNSADARQSVLDYAGRFASQLNAAFQSVKASSERLQGQIGDTVDQINRLAAAIAGYNARHSSSPDDPNADASLHADLEQLSKLADITTLTQADGQVSVVLGSGSPLVIGDTAYTITAGLGDNSGSPNPEGTQPIVIRDWQNKDITEAIQGGTLGGYIDIRNRAVASLIGDGQQAGSLNILAKSFADTVNGILTSGSTAAGSSGTPGVALFSYDQTDATLAASSFQVNPAIAASALAPVDASGNANGNALKLASLGDSTAAGGAGGVTFLAYYGQIAAAVGRESSQAQEGQKVQQDVVTQTQALRDGISGVSLDEQAVALLQFQRSYQAVAQLLRTMDDIVQTTLSIGQ